MIAKKILGYFLLLSFLLLSCWSGSWVIFSLAILICILIWHPTAKKSIVKRWMLIPLKRRKHLEWVPLSLASLLLVWFINSYIVSIYTIQSSSMTPAIKPGTVLLMHKFNTGSARSIDQVNSYHRLKGLRSFKRNDIIIFHFPEADTIFEDHPYENYHFKKRQYQITKSYSPILGSKIAYQPVSKRPLFIKRIIGLPGDTIQISDNDFMLNGQYAEINNKNIEKYSIADRTPAHVREEIIQLSQSHYQEKKKQVVEILKDQVNEHLLPFLIKDSEPLNMPDAYVFPFSPYLYWNSSYWGPTIIPQKGTTVKLSVRNLALYRRIIESYEENIIEVKGTDIWINNSITNSYTFKMNYYWVGGDNQPHSFDSRYWGFVPENHIVGTVSPLRF